MMSGVLLAASGIEHSFGRTRVLDGASLQVQAGRVHGLIGPNGAGKSTLVRVISGTLRPMRGCVRLAGRRLDRLAPDSRVHVGLAWTFQRPRCHASLTVREHLVLTGSPPRRATGLLRELALEEVADLPAGGLSMSQMKRLDVARAMALEPRVILLDEPFAGLDAHEAHLVVAAIRRVRAEGTALLLIEHRLDLLVDVADELSLLGAGRVLEHGAPRTVLGAEFTRRLYFGQP